MAEFLDGTVTDFDGVLVPGASVYVYGADGTLANLENVDGLGVDNPQITDDLGYWSTYFNSPAYTLKFYWGGRLRRIETNRFGQSAYEIAVSFGFEGTEEEWNTQVNAAATAAAASAASADAASASAAIQAGASAVSAASAAVNADNAASSATAAAASALLVSGPITGSNLTQASSRLLGRTTAGTGHVEELTAATTRTFLNVADGSTANATDANLRDRTTHTGAQAISTVTGLQGALDGKQPVGTYATLSGGKIPSSQIPAVAITSSYVVASQAAMLALSVEEGDIAIRSDVKKNFIRNAGVSGTITDWTELEGAVGTVTSVNGQTGIVSLAKSDVGLGNVDNTSDVNKPLSTATSTALAGKEGSITAGTTAQYWRGDKSWQTLNATAVGLGNVNNTSDAGKPVSTAQQTALNAKTDNSSAAITGGTVAGLTSLSLSGNQALLGAGATWKRAIQWKTSAAALKWEIGADLSDNGTNDFYFYDGEAATTRLRFLGGTSYFNIHVGPATDNTFDCGGPALRFRTLYAGTGAINTSDRDAKTEPQPIPDEWLDAWAEVEWVRYKFRDAVAEKGDVARWHTGAVAQQVRDAFAAHDIDAEAIGLLCFDEWAANEVVGITAGSRWGLRYDECFAIEAAYQRRRMDRVEARLAELTA